MARHRTADSSGSEGMEGSVSAVAREGTGQANGLAVLIPEGDGNYRLEYGAVPAPGRPVASASGGPPVLGMPPAIGSGTPAIERGPPGASNYGN